jgi:uncharacterized protein YegL
MRAGGAQLDHATNKHRSMLVITDGNELLSLGPTMKSLRDKGITVSSLGLESMSRITLGDIAKRGYGHLYLAESAKQVVDAIVDTAVPPSFRSLAVMLLIDRSASTRGATLEAAKEVARATADVLSPSDTVGVIAFDTEALEVVPVTAASNRMRVSADIARLTSSDRGTNVYPALQAALAALEPKTHAIKHAIVITDGGSPSDGVVELVTTMRDAHITVSVIALKGADRALLQQIADAGDGRFYTLDDIGQLPRLFLR